MTFQVDQCRNFHQLKSVCLKCGRRMPALCKEQQEMEDKARLFDELVANGTIQTVQTEKVTDGVHGETGAGPLEPPVGASGDVVVQGNRSGGPEKAAEASEAPRATTVAPARQKPSTGRRKPGRKPSK